MRPASWAERVMLPANTEEDEEQTKQKADEESAKQQQTEQTEMAETEQRRVSSEKMDALVDSIQKLADKMEPGKSTSHRKLKLRKLPDGSMDVDVVDGEG